MNQGFIDRLNDIINSHIGDSSFGARELSKELGISHSSLFRKVRSLTGKSINQLIREIRLKSALEKLKEEDVSVSEVAFRFGFSSPSYFTACFKKFYGYLPGEINKNNENGLSLNESAVAGSGRRINKPQLIIITFLLLAITATVYFLFSRGDELSKMTQKVRVVGENGEKIKIPVFNDNYISRIMVFRFKNLIPEDISSNWISYGIAIGLNHELDQFPYVHVWNGFADNYQEQINRSRDLSTQYFINGTYQNIDGNFLVTTKLFDTNTGSLLQERSFEGQNLFKLIDEISLQARIDVGYPKNVIESYPDIPFSDQVTDNIEAYKHYSISLMKTDVSEKLGQTKKSFIIDSTFAHALLRYANISTASGSSNIIDVKKCIQQAMRHRDRLRPTVEARVRSQYYQLFGQIDKSIALMEGLYNRNPPNLWTLWEIARLCYITMNFEKLEKTILKMIEIDNSSFSRKMLAGAYLLNGKIVEGRSLCSELLNENKEDLSVMLYAAEFSIQGGDFQAARKYINRAILMNPEAEIPLSKVFDAIDYAEENANNRPDLEKFKGIFISDYSLAESKISELRNFILYKRVNQGPFYLYLTSDSSATDIRSGLSINWITDDMGSVTHYSKELRGNKYIHWKKDRLINNALELFENGKIEQALPAFREAYMKNPEHYYLGYYIQHLEFIQSPDYLEHGSGPEYLHGTFNDSAITIKKENGKLIYITISDGYESEILPLSKDLYMFPGSYNLTMKVEREGTHIIALSIIRKEGGTAKKIENNPSNYGLPGNNLVFFL